MSIVETNGKAVKSHTQPETNIDLLLSQLSGVTGGIDGQYAACCPAHDDNRASLSIREDDNGRVLVNCHAGCTREDILGGAKTYPYCGETGELLFQVVKQPGKRFFQRRPDGRGGWINSTKGVRRVLYRLPELLAADPSETIFICEGEKDADALTDLGLVATCNPGGAGKWQSQFADGLRGQPIVILPDNDPSGEKHAQTVATALHGHAALLKVVELPGLPPGGDVSDYLNSGKTKADLLAVVDAAPEWKPTAPAGSITWGDEIVTTKIDELWPRRFPLGKLVLLAGEQGVGKGLLLSDMIGRLTSGRGWHDCPGTIEPCDCIYITSEDDPADTIIPRIVSAGGNRSRLGFPQHFYSGEDIPKLDAMLNGRNVKLVVLDPLNQYVDAANAHRDADVRKALAPWTEFAARHGVSLIGIMHLNKDGKKSALHRLTGATAYSAVARGAWLITKDDGSPDRRVFVNVKPLTYTKHAPGWRFQIVDGIPAARVEWLDETNMSANQALRSADEKSLGPSETDKAADWLKTYLDAGPKPKADVLAAATAADFSERSIERAFQRIGGDDEPDPADKRKRIWKLPNVSINF
mgnify:CR=1 FL=1